MRDIINLVEGRGQTLLQEVARDAMALYEKCQQAIKAVDMADQDTIRMLSQLSSTCYFARHWLPGGKKDVPR